MSQPAFPRTYPEWRTDPADRPEDAAYAFGHDLIRRCRQEALATVPADATAACRVTVEAAVDTALHNVLDLLEGFWRNESGPDHTLEYALAVCVRNAAGEVVERVDISPCLLDLPIGYWKWRDGGFR